MELDWVASPGATSYTVKRSETLGGPYVSIQTGITETEYLDTDVVNDTPYYYVVSATGPGGESSNSDEESATPEAPPVGNVYYVSLDGSDDNPGTIDLPFLTPQKAANVVVPGDTVYFRAGTYTVASTQQAVPVMSVQTSGTAGNLITFKNYGSEVVVFSGKVAGQTYNRFYGILTGTYPSDTADYSGAGVSYLHFEGLIFEYTDSRAGLMICGPAAKPGFDRPTDPASHITVKNCTFRGGGTSWGLLTRGRVEYVTVDLCEAYDNYQSGIWLGRVSKTYDSYDATIHSGTVSGSVITDTGDPGYPVDGLVGMTVGIGVTWYPVVSNTSNTITVIGSPPTGACYYFIGRADNDMNGAAYCEITNCLVHDNIHPTSPGNTDGMGGNNTYHCKFNDNVAYYNSDDGMDVYSSYEAEIDGNYVFNHQYPDGNGCGIKCSAGGGGTHLVSGNVVFDNKDTAIEASNPTPWRPYLTSTFYNNTCYLNGNDGLMIGAGNPPGVPLFGTWLVRNNIFWDNIGGVDYRGQAGITDSDYDCIRPTDLVALQGLGLDLHSIDDDPLFLDEGTTINVEFEEGWTIEQKLEYIRAQVQARFALQSGSPCVGAGEGGVNMGAY